MQLRYLLFLSITLCFYEFVSGSSRNLALFKGTLSSDVELYQGHYLYSQYAVDADVNTRYGSIFQDDQYFIVDLGEATSFNIIEIKWEAAYAIGYYIRVSNDSITWQTVFTENNGNGGFDVISGLSANARYIQFFGFKRFNKVWGFSFWEFSVYQGVCSPNLPCSSGCCDFHGTCATECVSNCFSSASCQSGQCTGTPKNCGDPDLCTYDYCDENSGDCMNVEKDCTTNIPCSKTSCTPATGKCVASPDPQCTLCTSEVNGFTKMFSTPHWDIYTTSNGIAEIDCTDMILYNEDAYIEACISASGHFECSFYYFTLDSNFTFDPPFYKVDGIYTYFIPEGPGSLSADVSNMLCFGIATTDGEGGSAYLNVGEFQFTSTIEETQCEDNCILCTKNTLSGKCSYSFNDCNEDDNECTVAYCDIENGECVSSFEVTCGEGKCSNQFCNPSCGGCELSMDPVCPTDLCSAVFCDDENGCIYTYICDDYDACTHDSCNTVIGCMHSSISCLDDGDACTSENCDTLLGCLSEKISCEDYNPCTIDLCDALSGCYYEEIDCSDGLKCTLDECNPSFPEGLQCVHHPAISCTTTDLCKISQCDEDTLECVESPNDCDDGLYCTIDSCIPDTGCRHVLRDCNDSDSCTTDFCDNSNKKCQNIMFDCNDDNLCTSDACSDSGCVHTTIACNDHNACTSDYCSPERGCVHTPISCEDDNTCTTDSCDSSSGCKHTNLCSAIGCDSPKDCNFGSITDCDEVSCHLGECTKKATDCNDGNVCTSDECISGRCFHLKLCS